MPAPGITTCFVYCYDDQSNLVEGAEIHIRMKQGPQAAGYSYIKGVILTATSDVTGRAEFTGIPRGAIFKARRGSGNEVEFTTADAATTAMPEILGKSTDA